MRFTEQLIVALELAARVAWPTLQERLRGWATALLPDLPQLAGHWSAHFEDPTAKGARPVSIDATLKQFGRRLSGVGHVQGHPADTFAFHGMIKRNVLYGTFARTDAHVLAGTGTFVLKIMADSKRLLGTCMWYDGLLDEVWVSRYEWTR